MRHTVRLSLLASVFVLSATAADDLAGAFKEGKASGQIRAFYIDRDYKPGVNRDGAAAGGYLKYETDSFYGFNAGAAFYTTNKLDHKSAVSGENDITLFGPNGDNETYLGEAYLQYKYGNTSFKAGRQKLDTPLAGSDDVRMLPNLFEAYVLTNTDVKDTTFIAAHVTQFAAGTFANAYNYTSGTGDVLALTSGYSGVANATNYVGNFTNMGMYAIGHDTKGVSVAAAVYSGIPGLKLQLWDYYAYDILNAVYAEANYGWSMGGGVAPYVAAQYIKEDDVGSSYATKVNSDFVGAKAGVKVANFDLYGAVSHNSKDSAAAINGGTITPWGGMPAYTQAMVSRHQFMAGTDTWKIAGNYDWKEMGINLNTGIYHVAFSMDELNGYSANRAWTAAESGFDIIYGPQAVKNLQLRFRGNFQRDYSPGSDRDEYRLIANYNF